MTRRYTLIALALAAGIISNSLAAASASAEVTLPEFTVDAFLTATFGKSAISSSGAEIKSGSGIIDGSEEINKKSGKAVIWLLQATLEGESCKSKGASAENILIPVTWDVVPLGHRVLIALLIQNTVTIECKILGTKVEILEGSDLLGEISPADTTTSKFRLEMRAPGKKQEFTEFENNEGKAIKGELKLKVDGGTATTGAAESETTAITTREGKEESSKARETELKAPPPETQKIVLKPIQNGGKCPEEAARTVYTVEGQTCEYRVENDNTLESVEVRKVLLGIETQCKGLLTNCFAVVGAESSPECSEGTIFGTTVRVGGVCYVKLEYKWKPPMVSLASIEIETRSTYGAVTTLFKGQGLR
jgi:hypothetical protein